MSIPPLSPRQGPLKAQSGSAGSSQPSDKPVQGRASVDTVTSQRDSQAAASSRQ